MELAEIIRSRRSIRLYQNIPVPDEILLELADLARLYPSVGNQQPIRTAIIARQPMLDTVFESLKWAMYLPDFQIRPDQRPTAYILLLSNRAACQFEAGAAAMSVMLEAQALGLCTCCLGIAKPQQMVSQLNLDEKLTPIVAIALGYGEHASSVVPIVDTVRYARNDQGDFLVPKYNLSETLVYSDL